MYGYKVGQTQSRDYVAKCRGSPFIELLHMYYCLLLYFQCMVCLNENKTPNMVFCFILTHLQNVCMHFMCKVTNTCTL